MDKRMQQICRAIVGMRQRAGLLAIAALVFCLLAFARTGYAAADSVLLLKSNPEAGATVNPGDTISYTVSIGRDGETVDWTWLRVTLGEGLTLDESSILLDCARTVPVDLLPAPTDADAETPASPLPIQRDTVRGSNGFVLLSSAMLNGDTVTFRVLVEEGATCTMQAETEIASLSLEHTLAQPEPVEAAAPGYVYTPPEEPAEPETGVTGPAVLLSAVALLALGGGGYLIFHRTKPLANENGTGEDAANLAKESEPKETAQNPSVVKNKVAENTQPPSVTSNKPGAPSADIPTRAMDIPAPAATAPRAPSPLQPPARLQPPWLANAAENAPQETLPVTLSSQAGVSQAAPTQAAPTQAMHSQAAPTQSTQPDVSLAEVQRMAEKYRQLLERQQHE